MKEVRDLKDLTIHDVHNNPDTYVTEMCSGSELGSCLRLIDSCIIQLKA